MRRTSYYMPLDEDIFDDPEVQLFLEEKGKAAFLDYLHLLLLMRGYKKTDYMIPYDFLPVLAKRTLYTKPEELEQTVLYCIKIGWFKVYEDEIEKVKFIYSERRQMDLRTWQVTSSKRSEAAKKGNEVRWGKKEENNENDNN